MFKEILYDNQIKIVGILKLFSDNFYLAGGTSIALQLGHRKSIDFDLFSNKKIENIKILNKLKENGYKVERILIDNKGEELTIIVSGVKLTFLYYPFQIDLIHIFEGIKVPDLYILGAMKFYTLGRRGKWKDYIDIYKILNSGYEFKKISSIAEKIFEGGYNEKLLREQLCYFSDIDYSEEVEYVGKNIKDETIKKFLCDISISNE